MQLGGLKERERERTSLRRPVPRSVMAPVAVTSVVPVDGVLHSWVLVVVSLALS
jgi:hypothetical protein